MRIFCMKKFNTNYHDKKNTFIRWKKICFLWHSKQLNKDFSSDRDFNGILKLLWHQSGWIYLQKTNFSPSWFLSYDVISLLNFFN